MESTIKSIVDAFFKEKKLDIIEETEAALKEKLGRAFLDKHILQITINNNKILIKTKTVEAKTELNLYKKEIKIKGYETKILWQRTNNIKQKV